LRSCSCLAVTSRRCMIHCIAFSVTWVVHPAAPRAVVLSGQQWVRTRAPWRREGRSLQPESQPHTRQREHTDAPKPVEDLAAHLLHGLLGALFTTAGGKRARRCPDHRLAYIRPAFLCLLQVHVLPSLQTGQGRNSRDGFVRQLSRPRHATPRLALKPDAVCKVPAGTLRTATDRSEHGTA
jgi:hypothetical protein